MLTTSGTSKNSLVSIDEANLYNDDLRNNTLWIDKTDKEKEQLLRQAFFDLKRYKYENSSGMVVDFSEFEDEEDEIKSLLKDAQIEQALYLTAVSKPDEMRKMGIQSANFGQESMTIQRGFKYKVCDNAYSLICDFIAKPRMARG